MSEVATYDENNVEMQIVEGNVALTPADILKSGQGFISTMSAGTVEEKLATLTALSSPLSLSENQGVAIELAGIMAQKTKFRNADDELQDGIAVYLVDKSGASYISVSSGVSSSVQQFIGIFRDDPANWPAGLTVTPVKVNIGKGKTTWKFEYGVVAPAKK